MMFGMNAMAIPEASPLIPSAILPATTMAIPAMARIMASIFPTLPLR